MKQFPKLLATLLTILLLNGCGVPNLWTIQRVKDVQSVPPNSGIIVGRLKLFADGQPVARTKGLFGYETFMHLVRFSDGRVFESPQIDVTGSFVWSVPPGKYEISNIYMEFFFPRPRVGFTVEEGKINYIGTLVLETKPEDVFVRGWWPRKDSVVTVLKLEKTRVVNEKNTDPGWQPYKNRSDSITSLMVRGSR